MTDLAEAADETQNHQEMDLEAGRSPLLIVCNLRYLPELIK